MEPFLGDHVGYFSSEFGRDFGSMQWSARLEGFSEQAGDDQFVGFYGMHGSWGSVLETSLIPIGTPSGIERFVYLDMGSDAKSSLTQTIYMGPLVDQQEMERTNTLPSDIDPDIPGFDENYEIYMSTSVAGDKGVYSRYDAGVLYEDSIEEDPGSRWYAGIASPRASEFGQSSPNLKLLGEGPNSKVGFSLLVTKDAGPHGYVPVADHSAHGESTLGAKIFSGTVGDPDDREVLVGAYGDDDSNIVVGKIETDEGFYTGLVRQFVASGTGTFTVTGSGRSDLYAVIYPIGGGAPGSGIMPGSVVSGNLPGADYEYHKGQVTAGFSVGDKPENNIIWSFEGGGHE